MGAYTATAHLPAPLAPRGFIPRCDDHDWTKPPYALEVAASRNGRRRGWPRFTLREKLERAQRELAALRAAAGQT
jgi:hypothetical protein